MAPTRLINTKTLDFEEPGDQIPYAILSHRWLDEEVSFQEWCDRQTRSEIAERKGYKKIRSFCREARDDGFDYVWVDTNCIDKANFSELSEAINSMFGWYRDAAACYVYLHDLDHEPATRVPDLLQRYGSRCEWFSRGWTLQELLAPTAMRFYARDWVFLGYKEILYETLSELTGINEKYLKTPDRIFEASISERMSWMSQRQTTKPEDIAYSLIGIFDINMPLLYGEGGIKAFRRLQEEIIKVSTDQTIFAWEWPRGWDAGTKDWVTLFAPTPMAFRNSGGYTPDDRLLDGASSLYSMSNFGLSISLQIIQSCSSQSMKSLNLGASSQLVYAGLHCVVDVGNAPHEELTAPRTRSLVAIPLLKQSNHFFRAAFPSMPIPINRLWQAERTLIYAPRLREIGSDVRHSIDMSIETRDRLEGRYCFFVFTTNEFWEIGDAISTPFWTKFEGLSCYIGNLGRTRSNSEAIILGIKHAHHPGSQFFLYLGLTKRKGQNRTHCHIEEAHESEGPTERNRDRWVKSITGSPGNQEVTRSAAKVKLESLVTMPNGMKFIPVYFGVYSFRPPRETPSQAPKSSVAGIIGADA
ncbi:heterokaryon incompatibility protein-domain-containing protein [Thelonectria olida]|uniref:Heterokaryon incompatibility protein-domain-containing protein n=1 Tax=Thelonectria olida TaxID=1576542 RepID=A0A9P9AGR0_9HYPO|nr:heterokaryon incompatibility protein-domain-containing protein [Thelonectria olida]